MSASFPAKVVSIIVTISLVVLSAYAMQMYVEDDGTGFQGFESRNILLYYGNGGPPPGKHGNSASFYDLQARYNDQACPTDYTDSWPSDLNNYRVIFIIMPGDDNDDGRYFFSTSQVSELTGFLQNGGRLIIQGEHSGLFGVDTVNDLLTNLGVGIEQRRDDVLPWLEPAATDITDDQVTHGVSALDMDGAGVSSLLISGPAISLVRDRLGRHLVAVDQVTGSPPRPGGDVIVYGDTQVLDDHQLRDGDGDGPFDNYEFADNLGMCLMPPVAVIDPATQTIYEGETAYFTGASSYDPDPRVDMVIVGDASPSMPDEWNVLQTSLPQIESDLLAEGYDLDFLVLGLDHGTETPSKYPVMDGWLDYGARYDSTGGIIQDCLRNTQISNPHEHNWNSANPSISLIDPSLRCDDYSSHMSEGWAQGAAYIAINHPWRTGATRIVVPIGDSAPWHQYIDGGYQESLLGHPNLLDEDWTVINETSQILVDSGVVAFPMYDDTNDPDGSGPLVGPQQQLFLLMADLTGGMAFPISNSQGFIDNTKELIRSVVLTYSWDFDANVDSDLDGDFTNDNEATGEDASYSYHDDCACIVTLTVSDATGKVDSAQAVVNVVNVDPTIEGDAQSFSNGTVVFRIAGEKWHDVVLHLYQDGIEIGSAQIVRYPGSPDEQAVELANVTLDFTTTYSITAEYTPMDDPINGEIWGATPAWVIVRYEDGTEGRLQHTFNVRHEDTWLWEVDSLFSEIDAISMTFVATATDPGSDDLTFDWDWGDTTVDSATYYNNGVSPDPYPSPDYNPMSATDVQSHLFTGSGPYTITLTVTDDDGGSVSTTLVIG